MDFIEMGSKCKNIGAKQKKIGRFENLAQVFPPPSEISSMSAHVSI